MLQHARADVLESSGKPLALVAAQFARARDIRKRSGRAMDPAQPPCNAQPLSAANAAMNLARVLTCQSQEVIDVANKQHRLGRLSACACSFGDPMPGALFLFCAPAARAPNYAGDKQPGHRRHQYPLRRCALLAWPKRGA